MKKTLIIAAALCAFGLTACETTVPKHGKFEETEFFPDGSVKKKTTAESDYSLYVGVNKAPSPVAKVNVPAPGGGNYVIEIPMVAGQTQSVAAPQQEVSGFDKLFDRTLRVGEILLRGYGIARGADVALEQSRNQRDQAIATTNGFVGLGGAIRDTAGAGFVALGQVPRVSTVNVTGNALIGDGTQTVNTNSNNVTRNCQGGAAAPGGNGSGTTSGLPGVTGTGGNQTNAPGASGGNGGPANC